MENNLIKIHVDAYKMRLYSSLSRTMHGILEPYAAALNGFQCGNRWQAGSLTTESNVRIHSCEKGTQCAVMSEPGSQKPSRIVWITPIITHTRNGEIVPELGAGGGGADLNRAHNLELNNSAEILKLLQFCSDQIADRDVRARVLRKISHAVSSHTKTIDNLDFGLEEIGQEISVERLPELLVSLENDRQIIPRKRPHSDAEMHFVGIGSYQEQTLPNRIVSQCCLIPIGVILANLCPSIFLILDIPLSMNFVTLWQPFDLVISILAR